MADPLSILRADHREVERLLERLSKAEEPSDRSALLDEIESALSLHMEIEESLVYAVVPEVKGQWNALGDAIVQAREMAGRPVPDSAMTPSSRSTATTAPAKKSGAKKSGAKKAPAKKAAAKKAAATKAPAKKQAARSR